MNILSLGNNTLSYKPQKVNHTRKAPNQTSFGNRFFIAVKGSQTSAKIFTPTPDFSVFSRLKELCCHPTLKDSPIRIMPDVHPSGSTLVGLSVKGNPSNAIPGIISGDIGCGMLCVKLENQATSKDYPLLERVLRTFLSGKKTMEPTAKRKYVREIAPTIQDLGKKYNVPTGRMLSDLGTVGGGNHFVEVDKDALGNFYLVIHSGSRSMGREVFSHYSKIAQAQNPYRIRELSFLNPHESADYMDDMRKAIRYSSLNRRIIADEILSKLGWRERSSFEAIHNYIDANGMIRKGAINAEKGQEVIIPLNMRDGAILATGKGNPDWNFTAPHGAGRRFSRAAAASRISIDDYRQAMRGIFSGSISEHTLDESPFAYKNTQEILDNIGDTVRVKTVIKPTFNFKD
ncbi:MAG: RtcB family protein [bacterium]|nr:RtcB family protein [bacterium]